MGVGWRVFEAHESGGFGLLCGRNALEGLLQTLSGACQGHGEMGSVLDWEFLALLVLQFDWRVVCWKRGLEAIVGNIFVVVLLFVLW